MYVHQSVILRRRGGKTEGGKEVISSQKRRYLWPIVCIQDTQMTYVRDVCIVEEEEDKYLSDGFCVGVSSMYM